MRSLSAAPSKAAEPSSHSPSRLRGHTVLASWAYPIRLWLTPEGMAVRNLGEGDADESADGLVLGEETVVTIE